MKTNIILKFENEASDYEGTLLSYMSPPDQIAFERTYDKAIGQLGNEPIRAEWLLWFIWRALRREKGLDQPFDEWTEGLVEYSLPDDPAEDTEADPTTPTARPE